MDADDLRADRERLTWLDRSVESEVLFAVQDSHGQFLRHRRQGHLSQHRQAWHHREDRRREGAVEMNGYGVVGRVGIGDGPLDRRDERRLLGPAADGLGVEFGSWHKETLGAVRSGANDCN